MADNPMEFLLEPNGKGAYRVMVDGHDLSNAISRITLDQTGSGPAVVHLATVPMDIKVNLPDAELKFLETLERPSNGD